VVPSWAAHEHLNADPDERAILFAVHDTPLMKAVDKYRVEALDERQAQTSTFLAAVAA
jgi:gentisate 1,2-dioxygenase